MAFLTSPAWAQAVNTAATPATPAGAGIMSFLPLLLIFGVFYFLVIRPQTKKMREHQAMVKALRRGDRVVTAGGLHGSIHRIVDDNTVVVELAPDVRVTAVRSTISSVETKGVPLDSESSKPAAKKSAKSKPAPTPANTDSDASNG